MQAYGFANRCLSEITAEMLSSDDLVKFLYYTDNADEDFLQNAKPTANKIIDKHIYTGRRVPDNLICQDLIQYDYLKGISLFYTVKVGKQL